MERRPRLRQSDSALIAGPADASRTDFADAVSAISAAFGDPTRRAIYLYAHRCAEGVTASETADHFDLPGTKIMDEGSDTIWKYRKCSTWGPGGWYVGIWYANYLRDDHYMRVADKVAREPCSVGDYIWSCA